MVHIGNTPASNFASVTKDTFSGNGSTTAFTLSKAATTNGVAVFVENVRQIPTTAYAVSGTTLTFTAAPVSGTNNIYVLHHNTPASTATHPAAQALTATSGTFSSAVTINTTDTNFDVGADDLIVGSGSGDSGITIYTGGSVGDKGSIFFADSTVGSSAEKKGQISYEQNNEIMTFFTNDTLAMQIDLNGHVTMPKQSAFLAEFTTENSNISINTNVHLYFDVERFDKNADFASNTFTAPVTGTYAFFSQTRFDYMDLDAAYYYYNLVTSNRTVLLDIIDPDAFDSDPLFWTLQGSTLVDMDAGDTAKIHVTQSGGSAQTDAVTGNFSGYLVA